MSITKVNGGDRGSNFQVNMNLLRLKFTAATVIKKGQPVVVTGDNTVSVANDTSTSSGSKPIVGIAYNDAAIGQELAVHTPIYATIDGKAGSASMAAGMAVKIESYTDDVPNYVFPVSGEIVDAVVLTGGTDAGDDIKLGLIPSFMWWSA